VEAIGGRHRVRSRRPEFLLEASRGFGRNERPTTRESSSNALRPNSSPSEQYTPGIEWSAGGENAPSACSAMAKVGEATRMLPGRRAAFQRIHENGAAFQQQNWNTASRKSLLNHLPLNQFALGRFSTLHSAGFSSTGIVPKHVVDVSKKKKKRKKEARIFTLALVRWR